MHRLGLGLGSIPILFILYAFSATIYDKGPYDTIINITRSDAEFIFQFAIVAAALYGFCWVIGWIIAGFMAD
jgi:hypothetical protein